jgi:site-specific DNA-methyltransferase (adenine-specific)
MACEQTGRVCYGIELDEKFADVIVNRYVEAVGSTDGVFLVRDGVQTPWDKVPKPEVKPDE